jgi:hypothetical protein
MKTIKAKLQTRKPGGGLLGAELAELAKAATAKDVPQPNEELNDMVGQRAVQMFWGLFAAQPVRENLTQPDQNRLLLPCRWSRPSTPTASPRLTRYVLLHSLQAGMGRRHLLRLSWADMR